MKITNKNSLPLSLVQALEGDSYSRGDARISVTSLWKPARIVALEQQYADKLESDVSDSLWSLLGRGLHEVLAKADKDAVTETRLSTMIEGWKISGQFDRFIREEKKLQDYKVTSAWSLVFESRNDDWEKQLNSYAYLLRESGEEVESLEVVAILRDWSKSEALRNADYPQCAIQIVPVKMWTRAEAGEKIRERVLWQQKALEELPLCTLKEQWARPTKWAVMKKERKTAIKLYDSQEEARAHLESEGGNLLYIEERRGSKTRCESYCSVRDFCDQYSKERGI